MSVKSDITALLEDGADYDRIQTETGAERKYIRTIAATWRKTQKTPPAVEEIKENDGDGDQLNIINDTEDEMSENNQTTKQKTGNEYHKEWVDKKAFECNCGCVLNRKSTFCPHCGVTLDWSGF